MSQKTQIKVQRAEDGVWERVPDNGYDVMVTPNGDLLLKCGAGLVAGYARGHWRAFREEKV